MTRLALQDRLPPGAAARMCFGCGADNDQGLRLKSFYENGEAFGRFTPASHHLAFPGILNGGIIATILDCHGLWTAVGAYLEEKGWSDVPEIPVFALTRKLTVEYLKPTPLEGELLLRGRTTARGRTSVTVEVGLHHGEILCARAEMVGVMKMIEP